MLRIKISIGLLLFGFLYMNAQTKSIIVAQDQSGDYKTVQQAFNAIPYNNNVGND